MMVKMVMSLALAGCVSCSLHGKARRGSDVDADEREVATVEKKDLSLPENDDTEKGVLARRGRAKSGMFKSGTLPGLFGVRFGEKMENPGRSRSFDLFGRFQGMTVCQDSKSCKQSSLTGYDIDIFATPTGKQPFCLTSTVNNLSEGRKILTAKFEVEPRPHMLTRVVHGVKRREACFRYDLGDVSVFLEERRLTVVNWAIAELALSETRELEAKEKADSHKNDLDVLEGVDGDKAKAKRKKFGHGEALNGSAVITGFRGHRFGEKYAAQRMVAGMYDEKGIAFKPVDMQYRKFKVLELGYAIDGKRLCVIRICADFPSGCDEQILQKELAATREDMERQLKLKMEGDDSMAIFEDAKYLVKLWYAPSRHNVRRTKLVGLQNRTVIEEEETMRLCLEMDDKSLIPKSYFE